MLRIDCHNHSAHRSPDAKTTHDEIARECALKGIDVVLITEHDEITPPEELDRVSREHEVLLLPGVELSIGDHGHFLAFGAEAVLSQLDREEVEKDVLLAGLDSARRRLQDVTVPRIPVAKVRQVIGEEVASLVRARTTRRDPLSFVRAVHEVGGFVAWAHPFVGSSLRRAYDSFLMQCASGYDMSDFLNYLERTEPSILTLAHELDAVEGHNGRDFGLTSWLAVQLGKALEKSTIAGSDGHWSGQYGAAYLEVDAKRSDVTDVPSLIKALRSRPFTSVRSARAPGTG